VLLINKVKNVNFLKNSHKIIIFDKIKYVNTIKSNTILIQLNYFKIQIIKGTPMRIYKHFKVYICLNMNNNLNNKIKLVRKIKLKKNG